jgi:trk system potassium uptake protein TrkH
VTVLVAAAVGEWNFVPSFLVTGVAYGALGQALYRADGRRRSHSTGETMASMAFAWLCIPLVGAVPFLFSPLVASAPVLAVFQDPANAIFESFSGFTSTGLSVVARPADLPMTLQWWRSLSEWAGGIGFALIMMAAMNPESDADALYRSELGKSFADTVRGTVRWIWWIYGSLTLAAIGTFNLLGMPPWQAINHGMTAVATGGFTITNDSFQSYAPDLKVAAIVFMISGAVSFAAYHECVRRRGLYPLIARPAVRALFAGIAVATVLLWAVRNTPLAGYDVVDFFFQATSALATAGFATKDVAQLPTDAWAVLIVCMLAGGASGATTGGLKLDRILLLGEGIWRRLRISFDSDDATTHGSVSGDARQGQQSRNLMGMAAILAVTWLVTVFVGAAALMSVDQGDRGFTAALFEAASALGSVGLSSGITGADLSATGKSILVVLMWLGRLEIFAALSLVFLWIDPVRKWRVDGRFRRWHKKPGGSRNATVATTSGRGQPDARSVSER